ncbi:phage terminase small subunit [Megamonas funiformis]|uniref:phage terminase small subunit n=1 Tax=Megamonas funiformis TaxID=437897 RepID=UPI004027BBD1
MDCDEKIKKDVYQDYCTGLKLKDIAEKYDISLNTLKSWIKRYKWSKDKMRTPKVHPKQNEIQKKSALNKNTNAVKHGLFAKYLPAETLELIGNIEMMSPLDILWENICLKYAAIIRSQQIMYVKDTNDATKRITVDGSETTVYQYKEAYEKQASFLMAQSRAMGTLMNLIKQYEEMCNGKLATEEQRLRIEKLKKEIAKNDSQETLMEDDGFTKAIENATKEVWRDD